MNKEQLETASKLLNVFGFKVGPEQVKVIEDAIELVKIKGNAITLGDIDNLLVQE